MDIVQQIMQDRLVMGLVIGFAIGWGILPQPEWIKPYTGWIQEKAGTLLSIFGPKAPTPPASNTASNSVSSNTTPTA